jgi:hypothetical protein
MRIYPLNESIIDNNIDISNEVICSICIENITNNNILLPCNHTFHITCILKWATFQISRKRETTCPLCKDVYEFSILAKKIVAYHIQTIKDIINQLKFVLEKGQLSRLGRRRITKLKNNYNKVLIILETEKIPLSSSFLYGEIVPLPNDIITLIAQIKLELEKHDKYNQQLSKKKYYLCKIKFDRFKNLNKFKNFYNLYFKI